MLHRKMLREMRKNAPQFISIFLLAALALSMYCMFAGHVIGQRYSREKFHKATNLSDLWVYSEGFSEENLKAVRNLGFVKDAQLRTVVTGSAPDCEDAQVDIYLERENIVNTSYSIKGETFDPTDKEGVWLTNKFVELRHIKIGDEFKIAYNGITFTKKVKGLIESSEYEFRQKDGDADMYLENIAFVYMSFDGFPIRDYVTHMIQTEKITVDDILEKNKKVKEQFDAIGISKENVTKDMLLQIIDHSSDDDMLKLLPYTQMIIVTKDRGALKYEDKVADAIDNNYAAMVDKKSVPGIARLDSELSQHESFSYIFMVIFVGIAILVIATSMNRMVEKQRTQIGTMNALGMKVSKIMLHYLGFSFWVTVLGCVAGIIVGYGWLGPFLIDMFAEYYIVPGLKAGFDASYIIISLVIVLVCVATAYISCHKILKIHPAEALRPAPPKSGKKCVFELLPFWNKLGFHSQYNLRDISRAKLRAFMGVAGCAVGMLLMVYGIACTSLVNEMEDLNFKKIQKAEYQMGLSEDAELDEIDRLKKEYDGELMMVDQIELAKKKHAVSGEKKKETITVLEGKGLYNLVDTNKKVLKLKTGEVALSRKLAQDMKLSVGDKVYWHLYSKNEWYEAKIGSIYQSSEVQGIAYLRDDFEKLGTKFRPSVMYSNKDLSGLKDKTYVTGVNNRQDMKKAFEQSMSIVNILIFMMVLFSSILLVIVLYNSGNLSFNERIREFATLKVLGLSTSKIRQILTVQNIWLSVIGIIIGAPLGKATVNSMMNSNGENFDYNLTIPVKDYLIAGVLVLVVSVAVSLLFSKKIKKLDMVEVLKGVE